VQVQVQVRVQVQVQVQESSGALVAIGVVVGSVQYDRATGTTMTILDL
jgi:hypothetical protein